MTYDNILGRLHGVKGSGNQRSARCPAHDDQHNSLSISEGSDGRILFNCHAGCSPEAITAALDLTMADLFPNLPAQPIQATTTQPIAAYDYRDATDQHDLRKERHPGKQFYWYRLEAGIWRSGRKGLTPSLYKAADVANHAAVWWVEGEKDVKAMWAHRYPAVSAPDGAKSKLIPAQLEPMRGKHVVILPDNDPPGQAHAQTVAGMLQGIAASIRVVDLTTIWPDLPEHGDVSDLFDKMGDAAGDALQAQAANTPEWEPLGSKVEEKEPRVTQAEILLNLVKATGATFFRSDMDAPYTALKVDTHTEVIPIEGRDFAIWLNGLYYKETGKPVGVEAVKQTIAVLSAAARFDSPEPLTLSTRVAEKDGAFWYDLGNSTWQVVKVAADGWTVCDTPPILFTRYRHQAAQSVPQPGGDVKKILRYVNIKGVDTLFLCWLVACFVPNIPHPMPIIYGEKGAAKSTASALLKAIIDPSALETMTLQNDLRTLAVNLQQHWFLPFDNVSHIDEDTSDTLCRAITGGGIQQRKLFTNDEDSIFTFIRCLAINGINNVATRPDLLDRSLLIELERIAEADRKELTEVKAAFEADRPAILGGILDTLSRAMTIFPSVKLDKLPRMADFARWGYAIGEALGGKGQEFIDQYAANRQAQNTEAINSDPVATLIVAFMDGKESWSGLVSSLLNELRMLALRHGISTQSKSFPAQPHHLSRRLRGMKSNLEAVGIAYENEGHTRQGTKASLKAIDLASPASQRHQPSKINGFDGDALVTLNEELI